MTLKIWTAIKSIIWKYGGSLITEQSDGKAVLSLGRVAFLALFGLAFWQWAPFWGGGLELPSDMFSMLLTLAGYNLGTKMVSATKEILAARKAPAGVTNAQPSDTPVA